MMEGGNLFPTDHHLLILAIIETKFGPTTTTWVFLLTTTRVFLLTTTKVCLLILVAMRMAPFILILVMTRWPTTTTT